MLVISRREGESVAIIVEGRVVARIMVVRSKDSNGKVRLGLEGPEAITFLRQELLPAGIATTSAAVET